MLLFRKIDETRWFGKNLLESLSVTELNTKDNELSVWMDCKKVLDIDLALAYSLTQRNITGFWCVVIPETMIQTKGLTLRQQDSTTCFVRMRPYHTNVCVPTIYELGDFAEIIHTLLQDVDAHCKYYTETDLRNRFYQMVKQDLITIDFNERSNQAKWDILNERQKVNGVIDFTQLMNVKPKVKKK